MHRSLVVSGVLGLGIRLLVFGAAATRRRPVPERWRRQRRLELVRRRACEKGVAAPRPDADRRPALPRDSRSTGKAIEVPTARGRPAK